MPPRNHDPKFLECVLTDLAIPGVKFTVSQDLPQLAFTVDVVMERAFPVDSLEVEYNIGSGSDTGRLERLLLHRLEFVVTRLQDNIRSRKDK